MKTYKFELQFAKSPSTIIQVKANSMVAALQKAATKALSIASDYMGVEYLCGAAK